MAVVFGKFCLDLAKLTYGGVFLSAIMEVSFDMNKAMTYGAIAIILLLIVGMILVKIGNKQYKDIEDMNLVLFLQGVCVLAAIGSAYGLYLMNNGHRPIL